MWAELAPTLAINIVIGIKIKNAGTLINPTLKGNFTFKIDPENQKPIAPHKAIKNPISKIMEIEGVSFNWKSNNKPSLGVTADHLQNILPELVKEDDIKSVNYNGLVGLLIECVKNQQKQIDELKDQLNN